MKPTFRLPTMEEIGRSRGSSGLSIVSTFSGCGGSCLGFEEAGYDVLCAAEFVEAAREVYALNHPGVPIDPRDVREVQPEDLLRLAGRESGDVDVLEGSPPCASFSTAGKRERGWGEVKSYSDTNQRSDDLFFEFARLVAGIRPRVFVAENVSGLVKGSSFGYFKLIIERLKSLDYDVEARVCDAQWLGVPQARQRLIFVGVRRDLGVPPAFPAPLPYRYSIRDALPWVSAVSWDSMVQHGSRVFDVEREPIQTILGSLGGSQTRYEVSRDEQKWADLGSTAVGKEWDRLRPGESSERYFNLVKPHADNPCPTITAQGGTHAGTASVTHPTERRKFYIGEVQRLCSFPDDFRLIGSYGRRWERLGRAVPPRMMFHVARAIRDQVFHPLGRVRDTLVEAG